MIVAVYCTIKIFFWLKDNYNNREILDKISDTISIIDDYYYQDYSIDNTEIDTYLQKNNYKIDFSTLKEVNSDTVAWLKVNGTQVEYPIVKTTDNSYYLNHNFNKVINSAGWAFADYRNKFNGTDKNIIIYGHNRRNSSMFGTLKNILKPEWYENPDNQYVILNTEKAQNTYKVFSIYQIEPEDYYITTNFKNMEFDTFINTIKLRSLKDFGIDVFNTDEILTLSTCSDDSHYRIVLHAKKVYSLER